ncbi:MAG: DNA repair protein RecO, partial [Actinobacteria bacterium]
MVRAHAIARSCEPRSAPTSASRQPAGSATSTRPSRCSTQAPIVSARLPGSRSSPRRPGAGCRRNVASYPLKVLVLRKTKLGETDTILTLLASDGHQVRAVAKGLRKPGSRFGGRLEPYSVVDLLLHSGKSLEIVTEARTVAAHAPLREDLDRTSAAAVIADVLDKMSVEVQHEPRLFGLSTATLDVLDTAETASLPVIVVAFLVKAMAMHGYRPELDSCVALYL